MSEVHPAPARRGLITIFLLIAAVMNQVDITIANVAMPHMQGSTSASREQIAWVLTSYIVAAAICTPLVGWLAGKFGRRRLILFSIACFTGASVLCGLATSLEQLILFRMLQGMTGAALVPVSQATMLDSFPTEQHGKAMAIFGIGAIVGPLFGPLLGGWITMNASWRWVFLINLPFGVFSWLGLSAVMPEFKNADAPRLDFFGFGLLGVGMGAAQLMLDRGQLQDWFESSEIWLEATVAATCIFLFAVHTATSRHPFVSPRVFADRNFVVCAVIGFFLGIAIYSPMSLMPTMLDNLMHYPVFTIGMAMAPRGIGVLFAMLVVARIIDKVDTRILILAGLMLSASSSYIMSGLSLETDQWPMIASGLISGVGSSIIFVPLAALAFATLPPRYRNEGTAMITLIRNFGASVGIAAVQAMTTHNEAVVQSRLTEGIRPDNPVINYALSGGEIPYGGIERDIVRQAMMVSYVDSFWALFVLGAFTVPLVMLLRSPRRR